MDMELTNVYRGYGCDVFGDAEMARRLPNDKYLALHRTIEEGKELTYDVAGAVASAMLEWAVERGATHYTHWFQPMTGATAEKRDITVVTSPSPFLSLTYSPFLLVVLAVLS